MNEFDIGMIKKAAKRVVKNNYIKCVTVTFITSLFISLIFDYIFSGNSELNNIYDSEALYAATQSPEAMQAFYQNMYNNIINTINSIGYEAYQAMLIKIALAMIVSMLCQLLYSILVQAPFSVGGCKFYLDAHHSDPPYRTMLHGFSSNYLNVVKATFLRSLKIMLWSLLFLIPGIVKAYETFMVPYIIAENPNMDSKTAFKLSKMMTEGEKLRLFILDLSFIGWLFLMVLTSGLSHIFISGPYYQAALANTYIRIKAKHRYEESV